jgi:hypothetical protein
MWLIFQEQTANSLLRSVVLTGKEKDPKTLSAFNERQPKMGCRTLTIKTTLLVACR